MASEGAAEFYKKHADVVIGELESGPSGLTEEESHARLQKYGINALEKKQSVHPLTILLRQFTSFLVLILIAAMSISFLIGEQLDAIVIAVIVVLNGIFGFVQEYKAERAIEALRKMTALRAKVIRNGIEKEVDATELVPGDIVLIEAGSKVPADLRLIDAMALQIDESMLTGESVPSAKLTEPYKDDLILADRENMSYMGTVVTKGRGKGIVCGTGMSTEIGHVAKMVQEVKEKQTPLQSKLRRLSKNLGIATIFVCAIVFILGAIEGFIKTGAFEMPYLNEMFLTAVALAVAAIPEGLPAIVTISLARGARRMAKKNALIRQLPAVETLGSTDVICSDKTGTLTKNEMTVKEIVSSEQAAQVSGEGYEPKGNFLTSDGSPTSPAHFEKLLHIGALCNDAALTSEDGIWKVIGDPTEGALLVSAHKAGFEKQILDRRNPRIDEIPFDSERKMMTTIHSTPDGSVAYVKGAPDIILSRCKHIIDRGKVRLLSDDDRESLLNKNMEMASRSLRVIGFAYKPLVGDYKSDMRKVERNLIFVGLQAMMDPPRPEVEEAIQKCKSAGIRTILITGDHQGTAVAIARTLGIYEDGNIVLTGSELESMEDYRLNDIVDDVSVYARVNPSHKAKILSALKKKGHVVAMTGDGVNDAPALKRSDIGVAMGQTGTDVAKEASDMVLTDDNFSSIVNAVEEGRGIYDSIKSFVQYTLSSNLGEILVIFIAILIGWPLPLVAIQILWVNLLTDGLPGLALGLDPYRKDIMEKKPRRKDEHILDREMVSNIIIVGAVMAIGTLGMFFAYGIDSMKAKSVAFTTLIMFQLFNVLTFRARRFLFPIKTSMFLIGSVIISVLLQFFVLYVPFMNDAFSTVPLNLLDWLAIIGVSFTLYIILELRKLMRNAEQSIA